MEAPYVQIDPLLAAFAQRHGIELHKNYRDADRSLRFKDALSRTIWIHASDEYGTKGTYQVSIVAYQDRPERYFKAALVGEPVAIGGLDGLLQQAADLVGTWSASDLQRGAAG